MTIHIDDFTFDAIIGLLDFERVTPQRVVINLKASYDYVEGDFINYALIAKAIKENITSSRYQLLETALIEIKNELFLSYPNINTLYLKISKPDILEDSIVSLSHTWNQ